jgi:WD40 repeat protein
MLIWQAHKGKIESAAFSPDGTLLATATGGTSTPYLWEPTTGKLARKLAGASGTVKSVCFAPDAKLFAAGTAQSICVWDTDSWSVVAELLLEHTHELAFGPGAVPVFAASSANRSGASVWDDPGRPTKGAHRRESDREFPCYGGVAALHFSPDGSRLALSTQVVAEVWNVADARRTRALRNEPTNNRGAVRFSPDGKHLALAYSKWVEVWALADEAGPVVKFAAGTGRSPIVWALNWTADGKSLLTAGNDGCVRLWEVPSARPEGFAATGREQKAFDWKIGKLYCAAFSPDGLTCAACSDKGQVVVWDVDA